MKSERRHELEHNTLDAEISKTVTFFKRHLNKILTIILVVLVLVVGWMWWDRTQAKKAWEEQSQYDQLCNQIGATNATPEKNDKLIKGFLELSRNSSSSEIAANSLLQIATLYSLQGLNANDSDTQDKAYKKAESYYKQIVSEYDELPFIVAAAKIGLGKLAETRKDIPEAKKQYQAAADTPGIKGYPVKKLADDSLLSLDDFDGNVKLASTLPKWAQTEQAARKLAEEEARKKANAEKAAAAKAASMMTLPEIK
ncbi:MAG: tetratricopeptide repeat protein [Phycisphaerae bacterium]|nr:tetratricopeptide repeat protein [Phycisphaerae bacterium]